MAHALVVDDDRNNLDALADLVSLEGFETTKAEDLKKQLEQVQEQSSALDPNKTWEALDHMKEANSELAKQATEEAISKIASLTEAQFLRSARRGIPARLCPFIQPFCSESEPQPWA